MLEPDRAKLISDALAPMEAFESKGVQGLVRRLMDIYFAQSPLRAKEIRDGWLESHWTRVERAAHSLKAASAAMGSVRLSSICLEVELGAAQGEVSETLVSELEQELTRSMQDLRQWSDARYAH